MYYCQHVFIFNYQVCDLVSFVIGESFPHNERVDRNTWDEVGKCV
jgi:hypothetical protein